MSRTTFDQKTILYKLLNESAVKTALTGGIYKDVRPQSEKEDVVINSLPILGSSTQYGSANVNVYVKDITENGTLMPDNKRLAVLSTLVRSVLEAHTGTDYNMEIGSEHLLEEPSIKYHYVNYKVNFEFFNL